MATALASAEIAAPGTNFHLSRRQKAAIIVRFLLNEGAEVPLADLPDDMQAALTAQMGAMRYVDRGTLADVVAEFAQELEGMGLTFPHGLARAVSILDGRISPQIASRLRKQAGIKQGGDPWDHVRSAELSELAEIAGRESTEVAAILLSKLRVDRAAELLGNLPGERARHIACAMSETGTVMPEAVERIGFSLAAQLQDVPESAFDHGPVERLGAILNSSPSLTREDLLAGLGEIDEDFAVQVRRAIFTFEHIPARLAAQDVPRIIRAADHGTLLTALAAAKQADMGAVTDYLLENIPKRMADNLRDEMDELGKVAAKDGELAMIEVVNTIRQLAQAGEVTLQPDET